MPDGVTGWPGDSLKWSILEGCQGARSETLSGFLMEKARRELGGRRPQVLLKPEVGVFIMGCESEIQAEFNDVPIWLHTDCIPRAAGADELPVVGFSVTSVSSIGGAWGFMSGGRPEGVSPFRLGESAAAGISLAFSRDCADGPPPLSHDHPSPYRHNPRRSPSL